jgi:hypothetical protein
MKNSRYAFIISIVSPLFLLLFSSCVVPTDTSNQKPALTLEYQSTAMGVNSYIAIGIQGGTPPYSIKSISDSTRISGFLYYDRYRPAHRLELRSSAMTGPVTIVVQDSSGVTGSIFVNVVDFTAYPEQIELYEFSSASVRIQGGTKPYSIEYILDTNVVQAYCSNYLDLYSRKAGTTAVTIVDSSPQKKRTTVHISVISRMQKVPGKITFTSTFGSHTFEGTLDQEIYPGSRFNASAIGWRDWSGSFEMAFCQGVNVYPDKRFENISIDINSVGKRITPGIYSISDIAVSPDPIRVLPMVTVSYTMYQWTSDSSITSETYYLTEGQVALTTVENDRLQGTWYGSGFLSKPYFEVDSTKPFGIWNGKFDVPYSVTIEHNGADPGGVTAVLHKRSQHVREVLLRKFH